MIYKGSCHCGHIAFAVEGDRHRVIECNCSICGGAPLGTGTHNGVEMAAIIVRCQERVDLPSLKVQQVDGRGLHSASSGNPRAMGAHTARRPH